MCRTNQQNHNIQILKFLIYDDYNMCVVECGWKTKKQLHRKIVLEYSHTPVCVAFAENLQCLPIMLNDFSKE